jgi:hypothetical protein
VKFLAINGDLVKGGDYVNIYSFGGDLVNYLKKTLQLLAALNQQVLPSDDWTGHLHNKPVFTTCFCKRATFLFFHLIPIVKVKISSIPIMSMQQLLP